MILAYKKTLKQSGLVILVPIVLSAFTHLLNPTGFPDIFYDEGVYMRRAMHVLAGAGPQEGIFFDHPYFGQLFLAGFLKMVGYPDSIHPSATAESIEKLYAPPRILLGILSVIDTILTYKIAQKRYGRKVALFSSILFAVMPITWITRRILLDSILLPFFLASILFAIYANDAKCRKKEMCIVISGALLGIAVFTKVPIFTMIPLVGYVVYSASANKRKLKLLGLWFLPVILIPMIWPAYSASTGQFEIWLRDVIWQTQRQSAGFGTIVFSFFFFDPVLFLIGTAGFIYAGIKRDLFILLWIVPFVVFLTVIGYRQYFYWIPVLPIFCIAGARLIELSATVRPILPYVTIMGLGIFGLVSTLLVITSDVTSAQYQATAFLANKSTKETTIAASPTYSWLLIYVFHHEHILSDYRDLLFSPVETKNMILVADKDFQYNIGASKQFQEAYASTKRIAVFKDNIYHDMGNYPYTSLSANYEGWGIEIRMSN